MDAKTSILKVVQTKTYRIQKDAMAEIGHSLKFPRKGAYELNDSTDAWFQNLPQSKEDIANRRFDNREIDDGGKLAEIAADEEGLSRILKGSDKHRIVFVRHKGEPYQFYGLYKYNDVDHANRCVKRKRISPEIDTADVHVYRCEKKGWRWKS